MLTRPAASERFTGTCANRGVPVVALIFRRLATHVGLLDHIWLAVRPLLAGGCCRMLQQGWQTTTFLKGLSHPIDAAPINI